MEVLMGSLIVLAFFIVLYFFFHKRDSRSKTNFSSAKKMAELNLIEEAKERKRIELEKAEIKRKKNEERIRLDELVDETFIVVHKTYNHVNRPTIIIKRSNNMYAYTQHQGKIEDVPEVIQIDNEAKKSLIWFEEDVYQRQAKGGIKDDQIEY